MCESRVDQFILFSKHPWAVFSHRQLGGVTPGLVMPKSSIAKPYSRRMSESSNSLSNGVAQVDD